MDGVILKAFIKKIIRPRQFPGSPNKARIVLRTPQYHKYIINPPQRTSVVYATMRAFEQYGSEVLTLSQ